MCRAGASAIAPKEKGKTGWVIDLTVPGLHKTSRCYGPAITPVSSLVVPSLEKLIDVRKGDEWDFVEQDAAPVNRASREYLFHTTLHSTRCYDTSTWTKRVKVAFQRFSPSGSATPPRLLRSAFVTALRSDPDCPRDILESAAVAMKHSVATQKASYDLEAQLRLTEKAFAWAENFAQRCDSQQEMPMEQDEGVDDVEGATPFEDPPEDEAALQEESTIVQGSDICTPPASAPATMASLLKDSPPSSLHSVPLSTPKRNALTSAAAPMASLDAMPREASKRQKKATAAPKCCSAGKEAYTIDRIIGGSRVEIDAPPLFFLEWEGFKDVNWQMLDGLPAVDDDASYLGFQVRIIKMGGAAEVLEQGARPSHKIVLMVMGQLSDGDGNGSARTCYEASGVVHILDMHQCTLDGEPVDWLLSRDHSQVFHTDSIANWDSISALSEARIGWGHGRFYPSLEDMRFVLLHLGNVVMPSLRQASEKLKQMCLEIAVFLSKPGAGALPIVTGHAFSVRNSFLDGGFIRDCLTLLASIERKDIGQLSEMAQENSDESAVTDTCAAES